MAMILQLFTSVSLCLLTRTYAWIGHQKSSAPLAVAMGFHMTSSSSSSSLCSNRHCLLQLDKGKKARIRSRTVAIDGNNWDITVWEWEKPAAVIETYWAVEQQGLALTKGLLGGSRVSKQPLLDPFGLVSWPGAVVAAQELLRHPNVVKDKDVLVLGSGVGIEAQAAAKLGARSVLATDIHPTTLKLLEYGAQQAGLDDIISTQLFDIYAAEALPACDLLILSDVLYNDSLASQVAWRCSEVRKRSSSAKVLISDSQRFVQFEADLNRKLASTEKARVVWQTRLLDKFVGSGVMVDEVRLLGLPLCVCPFVRKRRSILLIRTLM